MHSMYNIHKIGRFVIPEYVICSLTRISEAQVGKNPKLFHAWYRRYGDQW